MKLRAFGIGMIVLGLSLLPAVAGAATPPIGQVARITGSQLGNAEAPGAPARKLVAGDPVFAGERIRTGAGTVLQIEFTDKSRFLLGPNSEFEVGRYSYAPGGAEEDAFMVMESAVRTWSHAPALIDAPMLLEAFLWFTPRFRPSEFLRFYRSRIAELRAQREVRHA